jgi:mRNA interferase RelE/StbE
MEIGMSDTVVIERAEYERLREAAEELADLRAYDGAMADLQAGHDEAIPAEYAHRLIAGESPVRVYRELRELTQAQLSAMSGVNRVQIAEIEAGRKTGSVETVKKLAAALGVAVDDLV